MILKIIISSLIAFVLVISGVFLLLNSPPAHMNTEKIVIEKGSGIKKVAYQLQERRLISSSYFFSYFTILKNVKIISGNYKISKGMTTNAIIGMLSRGDVLKRNVTIPEGFNLYEIAATLEKNNITKADKFLFYAFNHDFLQSIGIDSPSLEGYIFPDTYLFAEKKDPKAVIVTMHKQLNNVLNSIDLSNLKRMKLNKNQLLTLSSLVEKEAQIPSERPLISAVFHNRLTKGMRLDSDPTVRYAVKKFKGRIRHKDLKFDSPFNTRKYKGLTPTPICSVGKDSIVATLNPAKSSYLYFVARNDGSHYFSKTLKEHYQAVDYYQRGINNGFVDNQKKMNLLTK